MISSTPLTLAKSVIHSIQGGHAWAFLKSLQSTLKFMVFIPFQSCQLNSGTTLSRVFLTLISLKFLILIAHFVLFWKAFTICETEIMFFIFLLQSYAISKTVAAVNRKFSPSASYTSYHNWISKVSTKTWPKLNVIFFWKFGKIFRAHLSHLNIFS